MKKLYVLSVVVAFVFFAAGAMASPPVSGPPEDFNIVTQTEIQCTGTVTETEAFNWVYFEGTGVIGATFITDATGAFVTDNAGHKVIKAMGFQEGAQVAYVQDFLAKDGIVSFIKNFRADSTISGDQENLEVSKIISFEPIDPANKAAIATHTEKVGLSVVSQGGAAVSVTNGILTLCPWATDSGTSNPGYPATNEGIAAGSYFKVSKISNFTSDTSVVSTDIPKLSYKVDAADGTGYIKAGFNVELWEGNSAWGYHTDAAHAIPVPSGTALNDPPLVMSRTSYTEHASADGTWSFKKSMLYESSMPGSTTANPISIVP